MNTGNGCRQARERTTPSLPRWLRVQFSLRTLFVATAVVAVVSWMFSTGQGELAFLTAIPLAEGLAVGLMTPKRKRFDDQAFTKCLLRFPVMVWGVLWIFGAVAAFVESPPEFRVPAVVQGLAISFVYLPGMLLYGGPAGIIGLVIGHLLRKAERAPIREPGRTTD